MHMKQTALAEWLAEHGFSPNQFAGEIGLSHHTVIALCGLRKPRWGEPRLTTLRLISEVTGISVDTLAREATGE